MLRYRGSTLHLLRHARALWFAIIVSAVASAAGQAQTQPAIWRLSSQPVLSVGAVDGAPAEMFTSIVSALRLRDGRYVVADQRELRINVYDTRGRLLHTFGKRGGGPGEFVSIRGLWNPGGDTIVVFDPRSPRMTRFLPDGTVLDTDRIDATNPQTRRASLPEVYFGSLPDGRVVLARMTLGQADRNGMQPDIMVFETYTADAQLKSEVGRYPGMVRLFTAQSSAPHAFSPFPWGVVIGDTLIYTNGVNGELHYFPTSRSSQTPVRTVRVALPATALSEAWRNFDRIGPDGNMPQQIQLHHRQTDRSIGAVPQIARMFVDDRGRIWLKEYNVATDAIVVGAHRNGGRWHVVDRTGRTLAQLSIPDRVSPLAVAGNQLLAVARDELDVQRFVVYQILT